MIPVKDLLVRDVADTEKFQNEIELLKIGVQKPILLAHTKTLEDKQQWLSLIANLQQEDLKKETTKEYVKAQLSLSQSEIPLKEEKTAEEELLERKKKKQLQNLEESEDDLLARKKLIEEQISSLENLEQGENRKKSNSLTKRMTIKKPKKIPSIKITNDLAVESLRLELAEIQSKLISIRAEKKSKGRERQRRENKK